MTDFFNTLPLAAVIGNRIFCVHGGLSPYLTSLDDISSTKRPLQIGKTGLVADLLWSDPSDKVNDWETNEDRGVSFVFGTRQIDEFLERFDFDLIVRAHMVVEDGFEFFHERKLVTIFSAPNYCGEYGMLMWIYII